MTWSQAFVAYLERHGIKAAEVARILDIPATTVHYWTRGSEPRSEMKRRVEAWTRGEVKAAPWAEPVSSTDVASPVHHKAAS